MVFADRLTAGAGLGPRVMISNAALERTGLLAPGSRASQRLLMKLPATADPVALRKKVEDDPETPAAILTVHGVGYRYAPAKIPAAAPAEPTAGGRAARNGKRKRAQ